MAEDRLKREAHDLASDAFAGAAVASVARRVCWKHYLSVHRADGLTMAQCGESWGRMSEAEKLTWSRASKVLRPCDSFVLIRFVS